MTDPLPIVFIVEDDSGYQGNYAEALNGLVIIVAALSLAEAASKWEQHKETVALVVMDGCVDNEDFPDSQPLIRMIRQTFSGPMIAASGSSEYREELKRVGCSDEAEKRKVPAKVLELLKLIAAAE